MFSARIVSKSFSSIKPSGIAFSNSLYIISMSLSFDFKYSSVVSLTCFSSISGVILCFLNSVISVKIISAFS